MTNNYALTVKTLSFALENLSQKDKDNVIKQANILREHVNASGVQLSMLGALEVIHSVGLFINTNEIR